MNWRPLGNIGEQAADSKGGAGLMIGHLSRTNRSLDDMGGIACSNGLQRTLSSGFQHFKIDVRKLLNKKCLEPFVLESTLYTF